MGTTDAVGVAGRGSARAAGVLTQTGRTDLLLHGEPLTDHARRALVAAAVEVLPGLEPSALAEEVADVLVLHDPLCPLTPADFIRALVDRAASTGQVLVGCRPVTDTLKTVHGDLVGSTVDRDAFLVVTSPVVLSWPGGHTEPAHPVVLAELADRVGRDDLVDLVAWLRTRHEVALVEAPSAGRRVDDDSAVLLLEAATPPR